jgi:membrane protein YdbS with pleckstrin-like domain
MTDKSDMIDASEVNESLSNQPIHIGNLSQVETMDMHMLSPRYRSLNIQISIGFWGGLALILAIVRFQPLYDFTESTLSYLSYSIWALLFLMSWSLLYHWFADPKKKYAIREHDVHFQRGLFFRRVVSQPIMRIQHIEIARGPIERSAGLASLQVFSAGGANHAFQIPGLVHEQAVELRQYILDHKDVKENG